MKNLFIKSALIALSLSLSSTAYAQDGGDIGGDIGGGGSGSSAGRSAGDGGGADMMRGSRSFMRYVSDCSTLSFDSDRRLCIATKAKMRAKIAPPKHKPEFVIEGHMGGHD